MKVAGAEEQGEVLVDVIVVGGGGKVGPGLFYSCVMRFFCGASKSLMMMKQLSLFMTVVMGMKPVWSKHK